MADEKIFIGNGKETKWGIMCSVSCEKIPPGCISVYNGKKYLNFYVGKKKNASDGKSSHYITASIQRDGRQQASPPHTPKPPESTPRRDESMDTQTSNLPF